MLTFLILAVQLDMMEGFFSSSYMEEIYGKIEQTPFN